MPRTNIPHKSLRYCSNKKRSNFPCTHRTTSDTRSSDNQQGASCPVNNILVFPKNSETTINVLGNNSQGLPYGNLLKKIKGRKRKEKQRSKKKQILGDVKPVISNVKALKIEKMKPRMNKHIIFLSDSDDENSEMDNQGDVNDSSDPSDSIDKRNSNENDEDDDVIFVETPAAEIIEIDDTTEQTETLDNSSILEISPDVNDFLDNSNINLKSNFNFELHGSEFKGAEFLKPSTVPKDMSESGSVSSMSDISGTLGMNVFNVVDFPQEKVNLFDDNNLEKFRNAITPQRSNKKSKNVSNDEECNNCETRENQNDNLPTLSDIQVEDNSRKQRGRSIIKELVNDRAYVLLSTAQKKLKNKKRKSKDVSSDTLEGESQNDNQESNKKKKKKKYKKRDSSPNEMTLERSRSPPKDDLVDDGKSKKRKECREENEEECRKYPLAIQPDLFESAESDASTHIKKSKKNKRLDFGVLVDEEEVEKRKRKIRRNLEEISENSGKKNQNDHSEDISEDNEEKRKKKNKKACELSVENSRNKIDRQCTEENSIQETTEEKKKKKTKRNLEVSMDVVTEKNEIELQHSLAQLQEDNEEKKKRKNRRTSELSSEICVEKNKSELECINIQETNEDKRKKKNRKTFASSETVANINQDNIISIERVQEERREIKEHNEMEGVKHAKKNKTGQQDIENDNPENMEEKTKFKKCTEVSTQIDAGENENATHTAKLGNQDKDKSDKDKSETNLFESTYTSIQALEMEVAKNQKEDEKFPNESTTFDHKLAACQVIEIVEGNDEIAAGVSITETQKKSNMDDSKKYEEKTRMSSKRTSETPENIVKKPKLEEHIIETVVPQDNEANTKIYEELQGISKEINSNKMEIQKDNIGNNTQEQVVKNEEYTEKVCEVSAENNFDSFKKRKKETSVSECIDDSLESFEPKRMKIVAEILQPKIEESIESERRLGENGKEEERGQVNEISGKSNENVTVLKEEGNLDDKGVLVNRCIIDTGAEESIVGSGIIENVENYDIEGGKNLDVYKPVNAMLVDNEGNIDMKITSVFSVGNKSIFPEERSFADDVDIDNFVDKNNSSWNADSSRFHSYNGPLFKDVNIHASLETCNDVPNVESISIVTATITPEPLDPQSNLESILPNNSTLHNLNEAIIVKNENQNTNDTVPSENRPDIVLQGDVTVKVEVESEDPAEITVEENTSKQISSDKEIISPDSRLETDIPSKIINQELPNDIEEIVKEKDNLDTVKRLCEFLEEARDPNDVLKKVSLLKQAYKDKSQNSIRLHEEVHITYDDDDVFSISSGGSSVVCLEDDVSIVSIDDNLTLANCDLADGGKDKNEPNEILNSLVESSRDSNEVINSTGKQNDNIEIVASTSQSMLNSIQIPSETPQHKKELDKFVSEVSNSKVKQNDKIKNVATTSQFVLNSTMLCSETPLYKKELDKFEVEDIQGYMSSDPKLWKIVSADRNPVRIRTKGKRCTKCREIGHLAYNCPNRLNIPKCSLCGLEGHLDFRCPNKLCTQCGRKSSTMQTFCDHCKHYRNLTCVLCKNQGHPRNKCPDLWRRYHLTVNHGPLVRTDTLKLKTKENLWCSSCAKFGHVELHCASRILKNLQPPDPRIHHYEDVYNIKPTESELDCVQPNIDEVPTTTQHFLLNEDSSSDSSSSDTSNNAMDNRSPEDPSISLNDTLEEDQSVQIIEGGLESLSPEFVVIDEIIDENQDIRSISNENNRNFFMTATIESLKEFLVKELLLLECKFKIKNIDRRFYAYREDDKKPVHKARFPEKSKENFYKELNMLFFGKLEINCGHKEKLKKFVNSTPDSISDSMRESLCYSYEYIFQNRPHYQFGYKRFLRMLKKNYGNQPWLY